MSLRCLGGHRDDTHSAAEMVGGTIAVSYAIAMYDLTAHMNIGFGDKHWSVNWLNWNSF